LAATFAVATSRPPLTDRWSSISVELTIITDYLYQY